MADKGDETGLSWDAVYALLEVAQHDRLHQIDLLNSVREDVRQELLDHGLAERHGEGWRLLAGAADVVQAYIYGASQAALLRKRPPSEKDRGPCPTCRRIPISGPNWSKLTSYDAMVKNLQDENTKLRRKLEHT